MMTKKKYFAFSYGDEQEKAILISKTAFITKGDLSGHVKIYHDTNKNKKYFAFSYGD